MKSWILRTSLVAGIACAISASTVFAAQGNQQQQQQLNAAVRSSLSERFPNITDMERVGSTRIDGVRVDRVRFTTQDGRRGLAQVTEEGHFISAGLSMPTGQAPPDVRRGIDSLLKDPPPQVTDAMRTLFVVGIERNGHRNNLVLDATGRLLDIHTQDEIGAERNRDVSGQEREKVIQHALQRVEGGKVSQVYRDADHRGYDVVALTDKQGEQRRITLNENGQILSTEVKIEPNALPAQVASTVRNLFKDDRITSAYRMHDHYFQFTQDLGPQMLTVRMRPAGEVMSAFTHTRGAMDDPMTAGFQESGQREKKGQAKDKDKTRESD